MGVPMGVSLGVVVADMVLVVWGRRGRDGGSRSGRECEQDVVVREGGVADWRLDLEFVLGTRDARLLV